MSSTRRPADSDADGAAEAGGRAGEASGRGRKAAAGEDVIAALLELGVSREAIEHAVARGRVEDAIFDAVLDPERGRRTVTTRDLEAGDGPPIAETEEWRRSSVSTRSSERRSASGAASSRRSATAT
jgi:hypothetical protein